MNFVWQKPTDEEMNLLTLMWKTLRGDEVGRVSSRNIWIFLLGIYDLKIDELLYPSKKLYTGEYSQSDISLLIQNFESEEDLIKMSKHQFTLDKSIISNKKVEEAKTDEQRYGIFDQSEKFYFKDLLEQAKVSKIFKLFIKNKASNAKCAYFIGKDASPIDGRYTYKPEINLKSIEIANNLYKNVNMIGSGSNNSSMVSDHQRKLSSITPDLKETHPLILLNKGEEYKHHIKQMKIEKDQNEVKEWTFWPQVNKPTVTKLKSKLMKSQAKKSLKSWMHNLNIMDEINESSK